MSENIGNLNLVNKEKLAQFIDMIIQTKKTITLGFLNQHGYNLMLGDEIVFDSFKDLDYLLRDGKGVELACKYWGLNPGLNLNGTDFIPTLIERVISSELTCNCMVFGTESPWLEQGSAKLFKNQAVETIHGFKPIDDYVSHYKVLEKPGCLNIVILAMGMPKQELVAKRIRSVATSRLIVVCGGAIIDFQSGRFQRAPHFMRFLGIEWLYRLSKEPNRMFKRYVIGIPIFLYNVAINKAPKANFRNWN